MKNYNLQIWMLSHAIQDLTNASTGLKSDIEWLNKAYETIKDVIKDLENDLPF